MISCRMHVRSVLLIGPTGAGKTPLGAFLEERGLSGKRCFHFDFGHQLRSIAGEESPPEGFSEEDHAFIRTVLEKGLLLENEYFFIAGKIITLFLHRRNFREEDILILNGLPRHVGQAEYMKGIVEIQDVIVLECSPQDVYTRIRCDTGGDRAERLDDDFGMVRHKLEIFRQRTAPLIHYYAKAGGNVYNINVSSSSTAQDLYSEACRYLGRYI